MTVIQLRRGNASQWGTVNPILADGEQGLEKDTGRRKVGNGVTAWNALGYEGTQPYVELVRDTAGRIALSVVQGVVNPVNNVAISSAQGITLEMSDTLKVAYYLVQPVLVAEDEDGELGPGPKVQAGEVSGKELAAFHQNFVGQLPELADKLAQQGAGGELDGSADAAIPAAPTKAAGNRATRRGAARKR